MCTSRSLPTSPLASRGFSLIELLVALALSLLVAAAVSTLWLRVQTTQVEAADRMQAHLAGRVVAARFEKDLRHATMENVGTTVTSSLLRADQKELVLLSVSQGGAAKLIEWEFAGSSLMRRHGPWLGTVPARGQHSAYNSSKTMLEGVATNAGFGYSIGGATVPQVEAADLDLVEEVSLSGRVVDHKVDLTAKAELGS